MNERKEGRKEERMEGREKYEETSILSSTITTTTIPPPTYIATLRYRKKIWTTYTKKGTQEHITLPPLQEHTHTHTHTHTTVS